MTCNQPISYSWNFRHRLVQHYWYILYKDIDRSGMVLGLRHCRYIKQRQQYNTTKQAQQKKCYTGVIFEQRCTWVIVSLSASEYRIDVRDGATRIMTSTSNWSSMKFAFGKVKNHDLYHVALLVDWKPLSFFRSDLFQYLRDQRHIWIDLLQRLQRHLLFKNRLENNWSMPSPCQASGHTRRFPPPTENHRKCWMRNLVFD